tara:strand:- start:101 stop:415 length:315 start_codon:yes stop_codon:yes gene_type:complete
MWEYLTDSAVSPLQKAFIYEVEDPLCSDVSIGTWVNSHPANYTMFSDCSTKHLSVIGAKCKEALQEIVATGVNMKRISLVLRRLRRQYLSSFEEEACLFLELYY